MKICHLIDQDEIFVQTFAELLRQNNYQVHIFFPSEYLSVLHKLEKPDIIIIDFSSKDNLGESIVTILKQKFWYIGIPIIAVTENRSQDLLSSYDSGVSYVLHKPFRIGDVLSIVDSLIDLNEQKILALKRNNTANVNNLSLVFFEIEKALNHQLLEPITRLLSVFLYFQKAADEQSEGKNEYFLKLVSQLKIAVSVVTNLSNYLDLKGSLGKQVKEALVDFSKANNLYLTMSKEFVNANLNLETLLILATLCKYQNKQSPGLDINLSLKKSEVLISVEPLSNFTYSNTLKELLQTDLNIISSNARLTFKGQKILINL